MEGPSLKITAEQLSPFINKRVEAVLGNTKLAKEILVGQKVIDIFSWGKHLVFQFDNKALRVHFLLWGSYKAEVEGKSLTGEYYRAGTSMPSRLTLQFSNGEICLYNCSLKLTDDTNIKESYDFRVDILSKTWDKDAALSQIKKQGKEQIADVLLDQELFAGVGNIIKNEVLYRQKINPRMVVKDLSIDKLRSIIEETRVFSQQFYEWRKKFELKKHLEIYKKSKCPRCESKVMREKTGRRDRMSYYCPVCQLKKDL